MDGPTESGSSEVDYIQRIMRSLTDSVPSQSNEEESGIGSSSYGFSDSYGRIPDISPWSYFRSPPELRGQDPSEAHWRSGTGSPQILSAIQREIFADFPWLNEELDQRRLLNTSTVAASSSEVSFPRSKEESDACTSSVMISALEPTPTDQVAWAQSILELQAYAIPDPELPATGDSSKTRFFERSMSVTPSTPFNSESLSSSVSDGEAELTKGNGEDAAGTSAQSGKRKREDAEDDDQETKKPINRPRKKGGAKRVREPRYAIRTRTDTEVMDDGYKWRKYGQKAVKNSPHPRNYYRCTTPNCPVRKRVERCIEDPTLVVTTYEGTHTHQSPSFLRGPPGYPGGLQALLATLSHHYTLAGNAALPPFNAPHSGFSSDLSSSPWLPQLQSQGSIQENLNLLRAHEQEAAWASSIKSEPGFQFPGPSFSNVSDLSYDSRMSHYNNSSVSDQLGGSQQLNSLISGAGPFPSQPPPFSRHTDYAEAGAALPREDENYRAAPCSQDSHGGLLEDMFRSTNRPISRA